MGRCRHQMAALHVEIQMALTLQDGATVFALGLRLVGVHRLYVHLDGGRTRDLLPADVARRLHLLLQVQTKKYEKIVLILVFSLNIMCVLRFL